MKWELENWNGLDRNDSNSESDGGCVDPINIGEYVHSTHEPGKVILGPGCHTYNGIAFMHDTHAIWMEMEVLLPYSGTSCTI